MLILCRTRGFTRSDLVVTRSVLSHCYLGDWFVLYQERVCKYKYKYKNGGKMFPFPWPEVAAITPHPTPGEKGITGPFGGPGNEQSNLAECRGQWMLCWNF
jgi:hypothetical protein